ncbi:chorismate mutase [Candidatus Micrarchaeota archaeon]|nr:chorismate mutase [Candidatus Micrarchaeota archaeon]
MGVTNMPASGKNFGLDDLRVELNELDSQLVEVISKRVAVVRKVAQLKKANGLALVDLNREKALVGKLRAQGKKSGLDEDFIEQLAQTVIAYSKSFYGEKKIAVLGPTGTFSAQAASNYFGGAAKLLYCDSFDSVFSRLETREADYAVIPIENNVEGAVNRCVDLLIDSSAKVYAEYYIPISYVVASAPGGVKNPGVLYAHPQAFAQCRSFVKKN